MKLDRLAALSTVAVLVGAAVLSGCSSGGAASSTSSGGAVSATHKATIAFVPAELSDNFFITMKCGVQAAAKAAGAEVTTQAPADGTPTEQTSIVDSIIASKPDLLIISAADSTAMQAPIEAAAKAGIKVVFANNATVDPSFAVTSVLTDDVAGGGLAFEAIKQLKPNGGKVLVIGSLPGVQNTDNRMTGFEEAAKSDPAFSYTFGGYSNNNATTAAQLVASALQKDPDIIGIFAVGELAAEGSATGLRQVGKQSQVTLVDYDAGPQQIAELKDNTVQALIAQHPSTMGEKAVQLGLDALAGKSVAKLATSPVTLVTRANVDTVGQTVQYKSSC